MSETSREFDWDAFEGDVIQQQVEKVAVYANPHSDIVIRQERRWAEEDDIFIVIARAHALVAARAILGAAGLDPSWLSAEAEACMFGISVLGERSGPKDPTAAERQRRCRARKRDAAVTGDTAERDAPQLELVG
jgi:hypothetical protein